MVCVYKSLVLQLTYIDLSIHSFIFLVIFTSFKMNVSILNSAFAPVFVGGCALIRFVRSIISHAKQPSSKATPIQLIRTNPMMLMTKTSRGIASVGPQIPHTRFCSLSSISPHQNKKPLSPFYHKKHF